MSRIGKLLFVLCLFAALAAPSTGHAAPRMLTSPPETAPAAQGARQPNAPEAGQPQMVDVAQLQSALVPTTQNMVPPLYTRGSLSLLPYLEYWVDSTFATDVNDVARSPLADSFQLFVPERLPLAGQNGVMWMRFVLQPVQEGGEPLLLDLGRSVPGQPVLYTPDFSAGRLEWRELHSTGGVIRLPAAGNTPLVCYLRVDGTPGWWFSPELRSMDAAVAVSADRWHEAGLVALAVVFVFCLFKGLVEPGQWRLWTLLYLAAAGLNAWGGLATLTDGYSARVVASLTTGGLALMLWPHVARHFLRSREVSRFLDTQLILLCLPGAVATLLPLVPGFQWLARYTQLWPAAMILFIPSALWACVCGAPACVRFLVATAIPPAATAASVLGLRSGFDLDLLASLPVLGVALGALFLLAVGREKADEAAVPVQLSSPMDTLSMDLGSTDAAAEPDEEPVLLESPDSAEEPSSPEDTLEKTLDSFTQSLPELAKAVTLTPEQKERMDGLVARLVSTSDEVRGVLGDARKTAETVRRFSVLAVSENPAFTAVLNHVLRRVDCDTVFSPTLSEALERCRRVYPNVVVFEGSSASPHSGEALKEMRTFLQGHGIVPMFLAYTPDSSSWQELGKAGFTHALELPIDDAALVNTLREFRSEQGESLPEPQSEAPVADPPADEHPSPEAAEDAPEEIPDLFGLGPSSQGEDVYSAVDAAKKALARGDFGEIVRRMERVTGVPEKSVARLAQLVVKAARSRDGAVCADFLKQLAATSLKRLG